MVGVLSSNGSMMMVKPFQRRGDTADHNPATVEQVTRGGVCPTLAVGAHESGEVGDEGDGREVGDVGDLQGSQQRLQTLCTKPAGAERTGRCEQRDRASAGLEPSSRHRPQRLAVDADFLEDVFEELRRALLHDVVDPQTGLQVLQEALHETYEVLGRTNRTGHRL